jgi:uncharacterized protein
MTTNPPRIHWLDTLRNFAAGLMTRSDKMSYGRYAFRGEIPGEELDSMYRANWLARKIVDAPAEDMTREWLSMETSDASAREELETAEKEFNVIDRVTDNIRWSRLYGGSAIYPSIADDDPAEPFEVERMRQGSLQGLIVLDRYQITPARDQSTLIDLNRADYWRPEFYTVRGSSQRIHSSRLLFADGAKLPLNLLRRNNYWSDSVLQSVYDEMQRGDSVAQGTASMFFEACVDILKISELRIQLGSDEGTATMLKRFEVAAMMKSMNHTLVLDATDDYSQKTNSFGGVPEVMMQFMQRLSGAADIPMTRLFGMSPAGMNSTGESDMRNYYDSLKAKQERSLRPLLERLYDILAMHTLGHLLDDLVLEFTVLWQQSQKDQAATEFTRAQRDEIYLRNSVVTEVQVLDRLRSNDTYVVTDEDLQAAEELASYMPPPPNNGTNGTDANGNQPSANGGSQPPFGGNGTGAPNAAPATQTPETVATV